MRINNYNKFILESNINELLNESALIVSDDISLILKSVDAIPSYGNQVGVASGKLAKLILNMVNKDFDSPVNHLKSGEKPGMISFIPEDKFSYDDMKIDYQYLMNEYNNKLLDILDINLDNLKNERTFDYNLKNSFKEIKKIDIDTLIKSNNNSQKKLDILNDYEKCIIYYFQNNEDKNIFVAVCISRYATSNAIINNNIPENRRTESKIGRLIGKLLDSYLEPQYRKIYTAQVIEMFVNKFIACAIDLQENFDNFKVVDGDDIKYWYDVQNYAIFNGTTIGHLGNSCMRFGKCQSYFDIYTKNSDVCKLLILTDKNSKLLGRALLWTLIDGTKIMDRIYTAKDSLTYLFDKWANSNNHTCIFGKRYQMSIKVKPIKYSKYPYMDTFCYYLPEKGVLTNAYDFSKFNTMPKVTGTILNALKNPKNLLKTSTYKITPANHDLVFGISYIDGYYNTNYVSYNAY